MLGIFLTEILSLLGEFNVSLLRGAPNPRAVFSSKAVGEPPLFLAASVFFAVKAGLHLFNLFLVNPFSNEHLSLVQIGLSTN